MELPPRLRVAVDAVLERTPLAELQRAATLLSRRYRDETRDGRLHLSDDLAVKAYLATRLPATFAAVRSSFAMLRDALPGFAPHSMLDVGSGPGTALWAAHGCWPDISTARMVEASPAAARIGRALAAELPGMSAEWLEGDATRQIETQSGADLVTLCYVLDELPPGQLRPLTLRLWQLAQSALVIVEPGTPRGWQRISEARNALVEAGATIVAPCPHQFPCPLLTPDWCHFARRVARTRLHRLAKGGEVPWEDEKFMFLAASRIPPDDRRSRIIAPPRQASGRIDLKLCRPDGTAAMRTIVRREGEAFRIARRADWGDEIDVH